MQVFSLDTLGSGSSCSSKGEKSIFCDIKLLQQESFSKIVSVYMVTSNLGESLFDLEGFEARLDEALGDLVWHLI